MPSVVYKLKLTNGEERWIDNPTSYPDPALIASAEEPFVRANIFTPTAYIGNIMDLCHLRARG